MRKAMKGRNVFCCVGRSFCRIGDGGFCGRDGVDEPAGYRMDEYRAPVPATLQGRDGGDDTTQAEALWRDKKAVFFDVMPHDAEAGQSAGRNDMEGESPGRTFQAASGSPMSVTA